MPDMEIMINEFVAQLTKRKIEGSQATARLTAELLRTVVSQQRLPPTNQAMALIEAVRGVGERLISANPVELAVGNIVRRVLHIIREENFSVLTSDTGNLNLSAETDDEDTDEQDNCSVPSVAALAARNVLRAPSLHALLETMPNSAVACTEEKSNFFLKRIVMSYSFPAEKFARSRKLKLDVIEAVNELIDDIDTCHEQISEQAVEHIHQNKVILTLGRSRTVLEFFCAAKQKQRSFRVFVAEGAPRYQGHVLAKELVARGVQTTLITDSAVFSLVSRVNMVLVGAHAVMANGGIIAPIGLNMVALAARKYAVPFVVVAGIHKLCPLYPHDPEVSLNGMRSPSELLEFGKFSANMEFGMGSGAPLLHVVNPAFDYVPPELVNLLITDVGGHNPSYMYRLIADYYSADDFVLQRKSTS
ncbi:hypothetical protein RJ640_010483 [Escallonia rubra]|uniref:Translation initiation factor eIF2B subunit beta n=1 Tax=Escallonia rubra TaxID=112253 RepID=A0AA88RGP5_9ASTE|nr:hypothetical protein RJ640_010483 [Escallonia rubra]